MPTIGVAGALQNADHAGPIGLSTDLNSVPVAMEPDDDLVAVHGDRGIFSRDVDVGLRLGASGRFGAEVRVAQTRTRSVELDRAHDEIGILWEGRNGTVRTRTTSPLSSISASTRRKSRRSRGVQAEFAGQFIAAERMVIRRGEKRLDFLADVH